ncbi:MAG: amino acid racemase [Alphaproteobacteria bacterium]
MHTGARSGGADPGHTGPGHVGIVACSAEGAALCYRTLCQEAGAAMGRHAHPEITLHSLSLADYERHLDAGDWPGVAAMMLMSARKLAAAGADFLICPDNTVHQALPLVLPHSPLPWLSIVEAVADAADARRFRRVGLTGTRWLVDGPVYDDALAGRGIAIVRPAPADRDAIDRAILDELVAGVVTPRTEALFRRVIAAMKADGCQAVILGCTEIPLAVDDARSPLPTLDSTRLLARAALRRALGIAAPLPG